ncbi:MAG: guanylate kinase [Victivallaceae bacterium]|nr:guanylate kinase [Victivallaceae bacterium]
MKKSGSIIVLSGPSGVGKSTLVARVREKMPELEFSISCTTRAPRGAEKNGEEYYFLAPDEFERRVAAGEFLEHAKVHAHCYGTLKSECLDRCRRGATVILDIDVQGAMSVRAAAEADPELAAAAEFVFIGPPSFCELEKRLRGRATDSAEQITLRLETARRELSMWKKYDYLVVNDDLDRAAAEMTGLFRAFELKTSVMPEDWFNEK